MGKQAQELQKPSLGKRIHHLQPQYCQEPKICRSFKAVTCIKSKGGFKEDELKKELDFDKWVQLSTGNK